MGTHQPHGETPRIKEIACIMTYQLAQIIRRSIGASVIGKAKGVKGQIVQRRIEQKELKHQRQLIGLHNCSPKATKSTRDSPRLG